MNNYVAPPRRRFIRLITLVVGFVILLLIFNSFRSSHDEVPKPLGAQPTEKTHFGESPVEHANHGEPANPNVPLPSSASISAQAAKSELNKKPSVHTERIEDAPAQSITTPAVNADYNSFGESGQAAEDVVEKPKQAAPIAPKPITPKVKAPTAPAPAADASSPLSPACAAYPKDASLVTIVKTGATEAFARLPTLLLTYLSCIPEGSMLIYSDMAQQIGPYEIRDALEPSASKTNSDFELYYEQKKLIANGGQIWELSGDAGSKAWKLDKHKNLNAAQGAWDSVPGRDWYLFTDADTYISWTGMFALLNRLKENTPDFVNTPLYVGSEVNSGSPHFNHGGSGYLLNTAAMKVLVGEDRVELREEYTQRATRECCGDAELAKTLLKKGIKPTNVRPVISGDNMKDIQFGPRNWCHPIATMHHVGPEEVQKYWEFENRRMLQTQSPILYEEFFHKIVAPRMGGLKRREDWDNKSWPTHNIPFDYYATDQVTPDIFTACEQACRADPKCFQWVTWKQECAIETNFKLGVERVAIPEHFTSGWFTDRIDAFIAANGGCTEPNWRPNPD